MSVSSRIADFILNTKYEEIPANVKETCKMALIDYVAVTFHGSITEDTHIILDYVKSMDNCQECTVFGNKNRFSTDNAALVNAVASHSEDYDDVSLADIAHPSVVLAPVVFAMAEKNNLSGEEMLRAFILAMEVKHKLARAIMPELTDRGWHTTSVLGTIGAATAACILYGLDKDTIIHALGIAATKASGLRVNFGTYTKPYHAGMAVKNGMEAVRFAVAGITASENAIEGEDGFALAFSGRRITAEDVKLGGLWDVEDPDSGLLFKKYPVCSSSHTAVDALIILKEKYDFKPNEIDSIRAGMSEFAFRNLIFDNPQSPREAKFSMPYAMACAMVYERVPLSAFSEERIFDVDVREIMKKVVMEEDEAFKGKGILNNEPAKVTVTLKDGTILKQDVDYPLGTVRNPLTLDKEKIKFLDCLQDYDSEATEALFQQLVMIDQVESIVELIKSFPKKQL